MIQILIHLQIQILMKIIVNHQVNDLFQNQELQIMYQIVIQIQIMIVIQVILNHQKELLMKEKDIKIQLNNIAFLLKN